MAHVTHPAVTMLRGADIQVDADRPMPLVGDGELVLGLPTHVKVLPAALSVVFPRPTIDLADAGNRLPEM